jgi:hypothetical protein
MWFCCCLSSGSVDSKGSVESKGSSDSKELVDPILSDWLSHSKVAHEPIVESISNKTVAWATSPMCETTYSKEEYDRKIDVKQIAKNKEERKLEKQKQKEENASTCFKSFCSKFSFTKSKPN